jgi:pyrroloquinoline-quinone synthase
MKTLERIDSAIERRHLLTHPFYTKWVAGTLPVESIREYARQYFAFESAFPTFLSAIHSRTRRPDIRQSLLENLWDEEHGEENHAELWLRFAEGMGVSRDQVREATPTSATEALVGTYRRTAEQSASAGIAAIHAYEHQVPAVAGAKIEGLRRHYGVEEERTLAFWEVHHALDVQHSDAEREILLDLAEEEPEETLAATEAALGAWWGFLDWVDRT